MIWGLLNFGRIVIKMVPSSIIKSNYLEASMNTKASLLELKRLRIINNRIFWKKDSRSANMMSVKAFLINTPQSCCVCVALIVLTKPNLYLLPWGYMKCLVENAEAQVDTTRSQGWMQSSAMNEEAVPMETRVFLFIYKRMKLIEIKLLVFIKLLCGENRIGTYSFEFSHSMIIK